MTTTMIPVLPESAPFTAAQRAWLNGYFAGLLSRGAATPVPITESALSLSPMAAEDDSMPWHDPALPMDERLQLAEGKPIARRLMAAMAQLDCGACGYECQTYAEAIASGEEKELTRCAPGGRETAKRLLEQRPGLKVVFMSGYSYDALLGDAISEGVEAEFLSKPFPPDLLLEKVETLLRPSKAR